MLPPRVHLITDRDICPDPVAAAWAALADLSPGTVAVHVREKALSGRELLALARDLASAVHRRRQLLVVNDRVDVALAAGADGVHLPSAGIPPADARRLLGDRRLVGVSCHGPADVRRALDGGADYATFGPVFDTPSKRRYGAPVGLSALADAARLGLPLVGLGGVDVSNAPAVLRAGAHGVAAIRAWLAGGPGESLAAVRALTGMTTRASDAHGPRGPHHHEGHAHHHEGDVHRDRHGNPEDLDAYIARMESEDRAEWQRPEDVLAALHVLPGQTVADVGAGPGYFTLRLARAVGANGRVFAVDVAPEMIDALRERLDRAGVGNVAPVLGTPEDPALPQRCDLIVMINAFHHVQDPAAFLARLVARLTPGGRIAVVDFHRGELPVGPPPEHKLSREDFLEAASAAGLRVVSEEHFLQYQYFFVLARA